MAESSGERIEARIGDRSIGITTKDLIPILLILMMGMGGYLIYQNIRWAMQALFNRQQLILNRLTDQDEKLAFQTREFARLMAIHDYNMDRPPEERLPLEIDAAWLPKPVLPEVPLRRKPAPHGREQPPGRSYEQQTPMNREGLE
jgi:hypothetical protein